MTGKRKDFREMDNASIEKMISWININSGLLEEGFFYYADIDQELSEKISVTQYIYERS